MGKSFDVHVAGFDMGLRVLISEDEFNNGFIYANLCAGNTVNRSSIVILSSVPIVPAQTAEEFLDNIRKAFADNIEPCENYSWLTQEWILKAPIVYNSTQHFAGPVGGARDLG